MRTPVVMLVWVLHAAACGGGRRHDGGQVDAGTPRDAGLDGGPDGSVVECSLGPPAMGPTRPVQVVYDVPIDFMRPPGGGWEKDLSAIFVDAAGVAVFGEWEFVRFLLDGTQVSVVPYPPRPSDGYRYYLLSVAQGATGYGLVMQTDLPWDVRFCVVSADGAITPASCTYLWSAGNHVPRVGWDGEQYVVLSSVYVSGQYTLWETRLAPDGTLLGETDLGSAAYIGAITEGVAAAGSLYWCLDAPHGGTGPSAWCNTTLLERVFTSTGTAELDLLPTTHSAHGGCMLAGGATSLAAAYGASCLSADPCGIEPGTTADLVVTVMGQDLVMRRRNVINGSPNVLAHRLVWDGGKFVLAESQAVNAYLHVIGDDGTYQAVSEILPLANIPAMKWRTGRVGFVPVGEDDYLIAYSYLDGPEVAVTRLARVRLLP